MAVRFTVLGSLKNEHLTSRLRSKNSNDENNFFPVLPNIFRSVCLLETEDRNAGPEYVDGFCRWMFLCGISSHVRKVFFVDIDAIILSNTMFHRLQYKCETILCACKFPDMVI